MPVGLLGSSVRAGVGCSLGATDVADELGFSAVFFAATNGVGAGLV